MPERICECGDPIATGQWQGAATRCAACASAESTASPALGTMRGHERFFAVECWCHRTTVWVRAVDNKRGSTGTCGLDTCTKALVSA